MSDTSCLRRIEYPDAEMPCGVEAEFSRATCMVASEESTAESAMKTGSQLKAKVRGPWKSASLSKWQPGRACWRGWSTRDREIGQAGQTSPQPEASGSLRTIELGDL